MIAATLAPNVATRTAPARASAGAPAPAPAAPVDTVQYCTPAVKTQIETLMAKADADVDSGTFAYGMGFCVGAMAGIAAGEAVHPLLGVAVGAAVLAGGFLLGRKCDREAVEYARQAADLNDRYHCFASP